MDHLYHIFLIGFFALIPLFLLIRKNDDAMLVWISMILVVESFSSMRYGNVTALKICGIVLFPYLLMELKVLSKSVMGKAVISLASMLLLSTVYFTVISPWEDTTGVRQFIDLPLGRGIKQLGTFFSELSIALYLAKKIQSTESFNRVAKVLLFSCVAVAISLLLEKIFAFDFYHLFSGGRELLLENRQRGIAYEPRGASQICSFGIILTLLNSKLTTLKQFSLLILFSTGMYLTTSVTGLITLVAAILTLVGLTLFKKYKPNYKLIGIFLFVGVVASTALHFYSGKEKIKWDKHIKGRSYILTGSSFIQKFEVFDAAALNFYSQNPDYLITGVGAGQMGLAASPYILNKDKKIWGSRIEGLPHVGLVYQLAQFGLIGISILIFILAGGLRKTKGEVFVFTVVFLAMYIFQMRYMWPLILGLTLTPIYFFNTKKAR